MSKSIEGFTLIEMAIVLSISAIIMSGGLAASKPVLEKMHQKKTERQMERINDQLASYVHRNNRLPCPANPNPSGEPLGSEMGSGGTGAGSCSGTNSEGIVPFRVLGMQERDARDAWGNLITYHVSPIFAVNTSVVDEDDYNEIHEFCRSDEWVESLGETTNIGGSEDPADTAEAMRESWESFDLYGFGLGESITDEEGVLNILSTDEEGQVVVTTEGDPIEPTYDENGLGSPGGGTSSAPPAQVNYDPVTQTSETLFLDLGRLTNSTSVIVSNFYANEDNFSGEYGEWLAYDEQGVLVGSEVFGPDSGMEFSDGDTVGSFDIQTPSQFRFLAFKAVPYGGVNETGTNPSGTTIDSSDYFLRSVNFTTANPLANINPPKARFCCPMSHLVGYEPDDDIIIVDADDKMVVPQTRSDTSSDYDDKDTEKLGSVSSDIFVPAFALISHGRNGHGAYLANGTSGRVTVSSTVGVGFGEDEVENADADNTYVYRMPDHSQDVSYFDDVIMWRTQDQIYSEFGNQSCQTP